MLCQMCKQKTATVFISAIMNGKNNQMYLCTECAKKFNDMNPNIQMPFPIKDILSNIEFNEDSINSLIDDIKRIEQEEKEKEIDLLGTELEEEQTESELRCSVCNTSFDEYKITGELGCSNCYNEFRNELLPIINKMYKNPSHIGKVPKDIVIDNKSEKEVRSLKEQLNIAIEQEEYEYAAELRDRIIELEANNI